MKMRMRLFALVFWQRIEQVTDIRTDFQWPPPTCGLTGAFGRFSVSSSSATTVANVIKYGMMAIISMTFITSLKKFNLFGQAKNLYMGAISMFAQRRDIEREMEVD